MNMNVGQPRFERPEDNLRLYLAIAKLPVMVLGATAPPTMPPQHKAHLNHLHVQPEPYRRRLSTILSCKDVVAYDTSIRKFVERVPSEALDVPAEDERTGAAITIPVRGLDLNLRDAPLPHPTTIYEMIPWMLTYPFQTLTRAMQLSFPRQAGQWDMTPLPYPDFDGLIWQTFAWRKAPSPSELETYYSQPQNPIRECSLVICMQPQWVLSEADIDSFKRTDSFPTYIDNGDNPIFKSAHRIWAKLWDICVRVKCRFWVLTSYERWIFGSFSKSFKAGHIFTIKSHNAGYPTIMETLIFHTAKSMGLADDIYIPEYLDSTDDHDDPPHAPPPHYLDMEFPDSSSEWDGMDDEPDISAGVSDYLSGKWSAYGSAANVELPIVRIFRPNNIRRPPRSPPRSRQYLQPVAGPSRLGLPGGSVAGSPRSTTSSYAVGSPGPTGDVEHAPSPAETVALAELNEEIAENHDSALTREYCGISRATEEVTDAIKDWTDNVDNNDVDIVDEMLQVGDGAENPNAITRALPIEPLYQTAMLTLNGGAGHAHLRVRQTVHSRRAPERGGYMSIVPELGTLREADEAEVAEFDMLRDAYWQAQWRELETVGVPVTEDVDPRHDDGHAVEPVLGDRTAAAV